MSDEKKPTNTVKANRPKNRTDLVGSTIQVFVENEKIIVDLSFSNKSKTESVYLANYNGASDRSMLGSFFEITSSNKHISYIGMMGKIKPSVSSFIELHPEETLHFLRRIDENYSFLEGTHEYQIRYWAYHDYPNLSLGDPVVSNIAKFQYTK